MIDLRSDTFTKPGKGMLNAMLQAEVGDDVFGEDPTVNQLERIAADMFGMEAALFCSSGTQTNQIAIKCHTNPGDEVICDQTSHIYVFESGGIAFNSGCQARTIQGERGRITAEQVLQVINPEDVHKPVSKLVSLENTANLGGGACYQKDEILKIKTVCQENNMGFHLDGARLMNAIVAQGESPKWYGQQFDSISLCLSKGLGAPVGSVLVGKKDFIKKAKRYRKIFGGGMRQAGYLAAAGIYALENNIERLQIDHQHIRSIAEVLMTKNFVGKILPVETNMVIFELHGSYTAKSFMEHLGNFNIRCQPISPNRVRMVAHLDVSAPMVEKVMDVINDM